MMLRSLSILRLVPGWKERKRSRRSMPTESPESIVLNQVGSNWAATLVLLSGASQMGKSYLAREVLAAEFGAVYRHVDRIYTAAVTEANMLDETGLAALPGSSERKRAERDARRRARDRKWPSEDAERAFFQCFDRHLREALQEGSRKKALIVFDGGTLRKDDELAAVMRCTNEVLGARSRIVRVTVEVPYEQWLQNRVSRMIRTGVDNVPLWKLTLEQYALEASRAATTSNPSIEERKIQSSDEMRALAEELNQR